MNFFFSSRRRHTFFFQAEDGIRDRSPSRGLGDVYKRQDEYDADRGRDNGRSRADRERRVDDEKDLFRALRLRRNDRGEIVVFI